MSEILGSLILIFCCLAVGFAIGLDTGGNTLRHDMHAKAIQHGCAQHDPKTGEFMWLKEIQP